MSKVDAILLVDGWGREILRIIVPAIIAAIMAAWVKHRDKVSAAERDERLAAEKKEREEKEAKAKKEREELEAAAKRERDILEARAAKRQAHLATLLINNSKITCATLRYCIAIGEAVETGKANGKMTKAKAAAEACKNEQDEFFAESAVDDALKKYKEC